MNQNMESIKNTRQYLLQLVDELTLEQLNEVPLGFNNNIIWHLGHLVASQQGVCYLRAGLNTWIPEAFYLQYKPGTKPEGFIDRDSVEEIKRLLFATLDQFETDAAANLFSNYRPWTTRYGTTLATINDAVQFLLFHEGLHVGYVMALKHVVKK